MLYVGRVVSEVVVMYIDKVQNHLYYHEITRTNYIKAYEARKSVTEDLNQQIRLMNQEITPLSNEDAYAYLQAQSNIEQATIPALSIDFYDFLDTLREIIEKLKEANEALAAYSVGSDEEESDDLSKIKIADTDIELILESKEDDGTSYYTAITPLDLQGYTVENLELVTSEDESGKVFFDASAELVIGENRFDLQLAKDENDDFYFKVAENRFLDINANITLSKIYLNKDGLNFAAETDTDTYFSNDLHITNALRSIETQYGIWALDSTDDLISSATANNLSPLEQLLQDSTVVGNERIFRQTFLERLITALYEEDDNDIASFNILAKMFK